MSEDETKSVNEALESCQAKTEPDLELLEITLAFPEKMEPSLSAHIH